ncbi:MAG: phospholipase D-like domain-containing protein [Elusimicrobia bacterium]|nr:phospholipase D-like domain-containing protein [Elusimicrobiota bacterium]
MIRLLIVLLSLAAPARAAFTVPGYELVYSYPVETTLSEPDMRLAQDVWPEMFDSATKTIDIEQFYVTPSTGEPLEQSLQALERAAKRGVKIRVLLEKKFEKNSLDGIARLKTIPGLELRILEWSRIQGSGIIHAKFFIVDSTRAYVGSQNFDWRSLKHIHEMGLAVNDAPVVANIQKVFAHDWEEADTKVYERGLKPEVTEKKDAALNEAISPDADRSGRAYLVASPWRHNPVGVGDSESELARVIGEAREEILVQNLEYLPLTYARPPRFYPVIDNALRAAAVRGVKIKILVSHWTTEEPGIKHLQSLAVLPNVSARVITVPEAKTGPIPFARVTHSKYMIVDGKTLWLGTSNWRGGYFDDSRNLELVVHDEALAARAAKVHAHLWDSPYAAPLEVLKTYSKPRR